MEPLCAPLLKFKDDKAVLAPEGLSLVRGLSGTICPVIFIGDGRAGKSYLASQLLGKCGVFESSDSAEPVTEGIDVATTPLKPLLQEIGLPADSESIANHLLVLDCEGGNNALATVRTLVNVFGLVLTTQVIFVATGMLSEAALQALDATIAARTMLKLDGASLPPVRRLTFVVNKTTLHYQNDALEKTLAASGDGARDEIRAAVRDAFTQRRFFALPTWQSNEEGFNEGLVMFKQHALQECNALSMGGVPLVGSRLAGLIELTVEAVREANEVHFPSMYKYVIVDGFLDPLVDQLCTEANSSLIPKLSDYEPHLSELDPREDVLQRFDKRVSHVAKKDFVDVARKRMTQKLDLAWTQVENLNEAFGNQVQGMKDDKREVPLELESKPIKSGPLAGLVLTNRIVKVETRAGVVKKKDEHSGNVEWSPWMDTGARITRIVGEPSFEALHDLPVIRGRLWKRRPDLFGMLGYGMHVKCVLMDACLMWWNLDQRLDEEAIGCINFLADCVTVHAFDNDSGFFLKPQKGIGWKQSIIPDADQHSEIYFEDSNSAVWEAFSRTCICSRTVSSGRRQPTGSSSKSQLLGVQEWILAVLEHVEFAKVAREELTGIVVVNRPALKDVSSSKDWNMHTAIIQ